MGWNPEKDTFFMIDTLRHAVYAFDYDLKTGNISNKREYIQFKETEFPDGMTIDSKGGFWIAMWEGSRIVHFDKNGVKIKEILLPVLYPTSCCFGGKELKTLFITTSKLPLSEKERKKSPLAGRIFKVETNTIGQIEPRFNG
jgi:sugar lactone lactonase YvrE